MPTRPIDLLLCVRYSIVYIVLHKETLDRPSGVLATATALLVTYVKLVFRLQSLKCFLIFFPQKKSLESVGLFIGLFAII